MQNAGENENDEGRLQNPTLTLSSTKKQLTLNHKKQYYEETFVFGSYSSCIAF